ncbi:hypothetical protein KCP78_18205 [Salmonella enterica subsp. enterica]|nr:hypothetical protein KCP78_18205 [Salmonella enterica subsp. enterica]
MACQSPSDELEKPVLGAVVGRLRRLINRHHDLLGRFAPLPEGGSRILLAGRWRVNPK